MDWNEALTPRNFSNMREAARMRGCEYARSGAVTGLVAGEHTLTAFVRGTETYEVNWR